METNKPIDIEGAEKFLGTIGRTQDEVADFLRSRSIKGPFACTEGETIGHCPIAQLLVTEGYLNSGHYVTLYGATYAEDRYHGIQIEIRHPEPVQEFIFDYDSGKYPDIANDSALMAA